MNRNQTGQKLYVLAIDTATNLPRTGDAANIAARVARDHAASAALGDTSATEIGSTNEKGWYVFDLTQAETDAGHLRFSAQSSTSGIACLCFPTVAEPVTTVAANLTHVGGTAIPTPAVAGYLPVDVAKVQGADPTIDTATEITLAGGTVTTGTSGTSFTATIAGSTLGSTTGAYDGMRLLFQSGTLAGEAGVIATYVVTSGTATFTFAAAQAFTAAPAVGVAFVIG